MKFELAYYDYRFVLKYYDTLHTYNIKFSLSCNHMFLSSILIFCPFNNRFAFHNNILTLVSDDFVKGIRENQEEFDLYVKNIKFRISPFFTGV